jgi:predicted kinase
MGQGKGATRKGAGMTNLTCMRAWSGAGKSTEAARIAKRTGAVIVNRDQLRAMMLNSWWTGEREDEDRVSIAEESQVTALLRAGVSVIVDATHLETRFLRKWARLATRLGVDFDVVDVICDVDECKRRAYARWREPGRDFGRYIDPEVIDRQSKRHPVEKWPTVTAEPFRPEPVEWIAKLPEAILVDVDGTIAHVVEGGRSNYDYTRVSEDVVDVQTAWLVRAIYDMRFTGEGPRVFIMSGRDDACREETVEWLAANDIWFDDIFMRPAGAKDERGNKLPDFLVKHDLFNAHIRGRYNVRFVLDDRNQVVDLWRAMGLKCLQVAPGDF